MKVVSISLFAAVVGAVILCPVCESDVAEARSTVSRQTMQAPDTATVRLHISGMTCSTCPVTARVALDKLAGVYKATVTLPDSLGVVKFDPSKVKPAEIAAHLTKMTGYGAKVLPDTLKTRKS